MIMTMKTVMVGALSALSLTMGVSLLIPAAQAANLAINDTVEGQITLDHDANWEFGVISNGTPFGPDVAGSTTVPGESASFSGSWEVNTGGVPDPGTGIIYIVDQGNPNLIRATITATWSTVVQPGFDRATISVDVLSSPCGSNLGPLPPAFAGLGITEPSGFIGIQGAFRNPATAAPVSIPSDLTIQYGAAPLAACHVACYTVLPAEPFTPELATLVDQFRTTSMTVTKATLLCNPVNKNGEDPNALIRPDHLVGYAITQSVPPKFQPVNGLVVTDQFGTLHIDAVTPTHLLVPSGKSLGPVISTLIPSNPLDHFVCYTVKTTAGQPPFARINGVTLVDQFGTRLVDLSKPSRLCNPVNKNGEEPGADTHTLHLMCYETQRSAGEPTFTAVSGIFVDNQFGLQEVKATTPRELCVPALKTPAP
jgi:hypothetical protein